MEFLKKLGSEIYQRVILSHRSTLTGLGLGVAIVAGDQVAQLVGAAHQPWAPIAATLVTLACSSLKSKKIQADLEAVKENAAPPSAGFAALRLLFVLTVILGAVAIARADEVTPASPTLGGTFALGKVQAVYGPRLLPGMLALDFKTGSVNAVAIGGLAYGVDFWADKPYSLGVAGFLGAQTGSPASISTGVVATVFHYAVVGWHHGVTGGVKSNALVVGPSVAF